MMLLFWVVFICIVISCGDSWKLPKFPSTRFLPKTLSPNKLLTPSKKSVPTTSFSFYNHVTRVTRFTLNSVQQDDTEVVSVVDQFNLMKDTLPSHPELAEGKLPNGLTYRILPNTIPPGRFEAHLEVLSGSIKELDRQQGMAHLLEHVAYMGSPKRQLISGTGSRTNAYTDFHHTVFFAACPSQTPDQYWKRPMLPMAFDALIDVLTTPIDPDRLEKERAAVLSEAGMVNKMDYRMECQLLSTLHGENRLSKRFPIGKEHQIKTWQREDLQLYHGMHYRPDNAILYVVGDVEVDKTIALIHEKFGHLAATVDTDQIIRQSQEFLPFTMQNISRHFPPLVHQWSTPQKTVESLGLPSVQMRPVDKTSQYNESAGLEELLRPITKVFQHDLLQSFSFHLFAKRPIEPVQTKQAIKRDLMKRMILSTLQVRLNIFQRSNPVFTLADFQQINWIREGCAVCSLDITTDVYRYADAIKIALKEIKRLGLYGLTEGEFVRYKMSLLSEAHQQVHEAMTRSSEEVVAELMELTANNHTVMHPMQRLEVTDEVLIAMTLDEVNTMAQEVCAHIAQIDAQEGVFPRGIVSCVPSSTRTGEEYHISEEDILKVVVEAVQAEVEPLQDTPVPKTLLTPKYVQDKLQAMQPHWVSLAASQSHEQAQQIVDKREVTDEESVIVQRQLSNGLKVNLVSNPNEPQRLQMRLYVPGGRMMESRDFPGSLLLAARTIQEGGAFLNMTREEVELFCIDHQVMVEIGTGADNLVIDLASMTTSPHISHTASNNITSTEITGSEAICQVAHIILTEFLFEKDAFVRGSLGQHEAFDTMIKSLESACLEALTHSLTRGDSRFLLPNHQQIERLTFPKVVDSVVPMLVPQNVEVTMAGDLCPEELEHLAKTYLGSVASGVRQIAFPRSFENLTASDFLNDAAALSGSDATIQLTDTLVASPQFLASLELEETSAVLNDLEESVVVTRSEPTEVVPQDLVVHTIGKERQLGVYLPDSEERAIGYLAGPCPSPWGKLPGGETIMGRMQRLANQKTVTTKDLKRWQHPLFAFLALQILQEVANRRLFSVVREERQLTYDASFVYQAHDLLSGGWYLITVTSSPETIQAAVRACKEALQSLQGAFGVTGESVASSKRTLLHRYQHDRLSNKFWLDLLAGSQFPQYHPNKANLQAITKEYAGVLGEITVQDIQLLVKVLGFEEEKMTVCVGIASPNCPPGMTPPTLPSQPLLPSPPPAVPHSMALDEAEVLLQPRGRTKGTALID